MGLKRSAILSKIKGLTMKAAMGDAKAEAEINQLKEKLKMMNKK